MLAQQISLKSCIACLSARKVLAVVRRMVTDLEMKGVLREAQTCFNLSVNLRNGDNLFQEFIRTFMTCAFPGSAFLSRLETEVTGVGEQVSFFCFR